MPRQDDIQAFVPCTPKSLPQERWIPAAARAIQENPTNRPAAERLGLVVRGFAPSKAAIAVMTTKYWRGGGVDLTVGFLDRPEAALRKRILLHMNAWAKTANVRFRETTGTGQVRIAREEDGYWSYVGTDILDPHLPTPHTMNLQGFTMNTPESEFHRVVRHETGHTLGCPHEHMRRELVNRIDPAKANAYFLQTQGWDQDMVKQQVLTPIEESALIHTPHADQVSIMCYQLPRTITRDGKPIVGGTDIDASDYAFMATIYPPKAKSAKKASSPKKAKLKKAKSPTRTAVQRKRSAKASPKDSRRKRSSR